MPQLGGNLGGARGTFPPTAFGELPLNCFSNTWSRALPARMETPADPKECGHLSPDSRGPGLPPKTRDAVCHHQGNLVAHLSLLIHGEAGALVAPHAGYIFIQTDKTIYTPEQSGTAPWDPSSTSPKGPSVQGPLLTAQDPHNDTQPLSKP